jgi:hypothetical protein
MTAPSTARVYDLRRRRREGRRIFRVELPATRSSQRIIESAQMGRQKEREKSCSRKHLVEPLARVAYLMS